MTYPLFDFVIACLLMGLGIGMDVAIATVARAGHLRTIRAALFWVVGVSLTHTLFPMAGYLLTYFSIQLQPWITPLIGVIAFGFIAVYLKNELLHLYEDNEQESSQIMVTLGLILAVSWDALWSGPAKSAQVIGWPEFLVWISFLLVGMCVAVLALTSLRFASRLQFSKQSKRHWWILWLQYSVIAYFGLLAISRYTLQAQLFWWQLLAISGCCIALIMSMVGSKWKTKAL